MRQSSDGLRQKDITGYGPYFFYEYLEHNSMFSALEPFLYVKHAKNNFYKTAFLTNERKKTLNFFLILKIIHKNFSKICHKPLF